MNNANFINACIQACDNWGILPTEFKNCMTWEEQVLWISRFLQEQVIPTVNQNTEAFNALKAYVENYFENLDITEEVSAKLDEMAEDGTLADLISTEILGDLTTLKTTDKSTIVNAVNEVYDDILTEMVVFGDSWSDLNVEQAVWSTLVSNQLRLNLHNYAVNGAGFIAPANNLIGTQITTANSDTSYDKNKVKYVVVEGGLNDYMNSVTFSDLREAIQAKLTTVRSMYPRAKVLYVNNFQYPYTVAQSHYWLNIQEFLEGFGFQVLNQDGFYRRAYMLSNLTHLTIPGQGLFANNISSALSGGEIFNEGVKLTFTSTNSVVRIKRLNHHLIYDFKFVGLDSAETHQTLTLSDSDTFSWYDAFDTDGYFGAIGTSYAASIAAILDTHKSIQIFKENATKTNYSYNGTVGID